jgi:hypothetical protein
MAIVMEVSGGRTKSSAELSRIEMAKAIKILEGKSEGEEKDGQGYQPCKDLEW